MFFQNFFRKLNQAKFGKQFAKGFLRAEAVLLSHSENRRFIKRLVIQFLELISNVNSDYCIMLSQMKWFSLNFFQFLALQLSKLELSSVCVPQCIV